MLTAAAGLFARHGYHGVSTRDVAAAADVNEVTIYRHYAKKRDLFRAVLESQLRQVNLRGDLLASIAESGDAREALARCFDLISATLLPRRDLLRLLQFSALELGEDFDPLLRRYLGELVEVLARYLDPWVGKGEPHGAQSRALILAMVAIVVSHHPLQRVCTGSVMEQEASFQSYSDLLVGALRE